MNPLTITVLLMFGCSVLALPIAWLYIRINRPLAHESATYVTASIVGALIGWFAALEIRRSSKNKSN